MMELILLFGIIYGVMKLMKNRNPLSTGGVSKKDFRRSGKTSRGQSHKAYSDIWDDDITGVGLGMGVGIGQEDYLTDPVYSYLPGNIFYQDPFDDAWLRGWGGCSLTDYWSSFGSHDSMSCSPNNLHSFDSDSHCGISSDWL